jgi:hypothetical protein
MISLGHRWTISYAVEIMPSNLRTKGIASYVSDQNLANAFNQFVNPIALAGITLKSYAVYIAIDSVYVISIHFYFPETKELTIKEASLLLTMVLRRVAKGRLWLSILDQIKRSSRSM